MNKTAELHAIIRHYATDIIGGYAHLVREDKRAYAIQIIENADRIKEVGKELYAMAVKEAEGRS